MVSNSLEHHAIRSVCPIRVVRRHASHQELQKATEEGTEFAKGIVLQRVYLRGGRHRFGGNGNDLRIRPECGTVDAIENSLKTGRKFWIGGATVATVC